jgi:hypothetical protein
MFGGISRYTAEHAALLTGAGAASNQQREAT